MRYNLKEKNGVTVLEMSGDFMGGPDGHQFHAAIKDLIAEGKKNVVVDLGAVRHMNSQGVGILMSAVVSMGTVGGLIKLCKVSQRIESILIVTRLLTLFETFEDCNEAVASFSS